LKEQSKQRHDAKKEIGSQDRKKGSNPGISTFRRKKGAGKSTTKSPLPRDRSKKTTWETDNSPSYPPKKPPNKKKNRKRGKGDPNYGK